MTRIANGSKLRWTPSGPVAIISVNKTVVPGVTPDKADFTDAESTDPLPVAVIASALGFATITVYRWRLNFASKSKFSRATDR